MYTSAQLQLLRDSAGAGAQIAGVDYQVGNLLPASSLAKVTDLKSGNGWAYDATNNIVRVTGSNVTLSGIDFGTAEVMVFGANVTIRNCTFEPDQNWYGLYQYGSGATVENCTFTGKTTGIKAGFLATANPITVRNNAFLNASGDAIAVQGGALVTGNYIQGGGYSAAHSDAIWVTNTKGNSTTVTDNFVDFTRSANQTVYNIGNTIRITSELGSASNVTVSGNYLLGGSYSVSAADSAGRLTNINIKGNYIGFSMYGDFYPGSSVSSTITGNTVFDWRNSAYSTKAWASYLSSLDSNTALTLSSGSNVANSGSQYRVMYGLGYSAHVAGGLNSTNLVGGYGRQYLDAGAGANIVTELSVSDSSPVSGIDYVSGFDAFKDTIDLSRIDADLGTAGQQTFSFIGTASFSGTEAQVRYYQDAATKMTYVEAKLAGDTTTDLKIQLTGLVDLAASNFALTSAASAATVTAAKALNVTRAYCGGVYQYNYTGVLGKSYTAYQTFLVGGKLAAKNIEYGTSSAVTGNGLEIAGTDVTLTRSGQQDTLKIGSGSFSLARRASEVVTLDAGASATINLQKGFLSETLSGFDFAGGSTDTLNLSRAMFSYVTPAMTDAQALGAVIAHATSGNGSLTISDSYGDKLTLNEATPTTLAAATNVHFV